MKKTEKVKQFMAACHYPEMLDSVFEQIGKMPQISIHFQQFGEEKAQSELRDWLDRVKADITDSLEQYFTERFTVKQLDRIIDFYTGSDYQEFIQAHGESFEIRDRLILEALKDLGINVRTGGG